MKFYSTYAIYTPKKQTQDAFSISLYHIAITDGVGGYLERGIDSGHLARELTSLCICPSEPEEYVDTQLVMGYICSKTRALGGSTMLLACLYQDRLDIANLGDCGMMILRKRCDKYAIVFESIPQQYSFNYPFQFAEGSNSFVDADHYNVQVQQGDLIITGTDGLWDNMFVNDLVYFMNKNDINEQNQKEITRKLIDLVKQRSLSSSIDAPFTIHARQNGIDIRGGKIDDITFVLSRVV